MRTADAQAICRFGLGVNHPPLRLPNEPQVPEPFAKFRLEVGIAPDDLLIELWSIRLSTQTRIDDVLEP